MVERHDTPWRAPILGLEELAARVAAWRAAGQRVVLCHGCFDPLHVGHMVHFEAARASADRLVVTLTPDAFVAKGPGRPVFPLDWRLAAVAALRAVDAVAANRWPDAREALARVRPDAFAKGAEFRDASEDPGTAIGRERAHAEALGIEVLFTEGFTGSATELLERAFGWRSPPPSSEG